MYPLDLARARQTDLRREAARDAGRPGASRSPGRLRRLVTRNRLSG